MHTQAPLLKPSLWRRRRDKSLAERTLIGSLCCLAAPEGRARARRQSDYVAIQTFSILSRRAAAAAKETLCRRPNCRQTLFFTSVAEIIPIRSESERLSGSARGAQVQSARNAICNLFWQFTFLFAV